MTIAAVKMNYEGGINHNGAASQAEGQLFGVPTEERSSRRRIILIAGLVGAGLIAIGFATHHKTADDFAATSAAQAPRVTVIVPGRAMVSGTISATGALAAKHEIMVGSVGEGGQVREVLVNAGAWVHAGQLLARVDGSVQAQQLANANANIAVNQADARLAQANLDRALKLVDRGFISKANIDQLTATRDGAAARVKVAAAQRDEIAARIRRLDIVAPTDGLVLERDVEPGTVVGAGTGVLFRMAQGGEMELRARLSESDLAGLHVGEPAEVTPVGAAHASTGHIWQLSPMIDAASRQGEARIALAYAPELRPGGFASAQIHSGSVVAPLLPESALQADNQGSYVYVIGAHNKAERRAVKIGIVTDGGVAITQGLVGNEKVVLRAGAFLSVGETVAPQVLTATQAAKAP